MSWYTGDNRKARLLNALATNGLDAILALTPENAAYLAGHGNYIATHWRAPGLFSAVASDTGTLGVVSPDFGPDPRVSPPYRARTFPIWTESVDVRDIAGDAIAGRIRAARQNRIVRPAQFVIDEVFNQVAVAVTETAPTVRRLGIELAVLPAASIDRLQRRLPGVEFVEAGPIFDDLRAIKDPDEIAALRLAAELTEAGISGAVSRLRPGMTESAVNAAYQIAVHERVLAEPRFGAFRQAEGLAAVGFGADAPRVVGPGQTIKFDMQVDVGGYHSDIGRTYAFDPTPDQQAISSALHNALLTAQAVVRPGVSFAEIHAAGSTAMHAAGFTNYSRGHLGHSVGLTQNFEEPPFIAPDETRHVIAGMVLSLELPYYVYGAGAFQLERMLLVTEDGVEPLDHLPFVLALPN